jgi:hypothetical protein
MFRLAVGLMGAVLSTWVDSQLEAGRQALLCDDNRLQVDRLRYDHLQDGINRRPADSSSNVVDLPPVNTAMFEAMVSSTDRSFSATAQVVAGGINSARTEEEDVEILRELETILGHVKVTDACSKEALSVLNGTMTKTPPRRDKDDFRLTRGNDDICLTRYGRGRGEGVNTSDAGWSSCVFFLPPLQKMFLKEAVERHNCWRSCISNGGAA